MQVTEVAEKLKLIIHDPYFKIVLSVLLNMSEEVEKKERMKKSRNKNRK